MFSNVFWYCCGIFIVLGFFFSMICCAVMLGLGIAGTLGCG